MTETKTTYRVTVHKMTHHADTLKEISEFYTNVRDGLGLGASQFPSVPVFKVGETKAFAHVSYNGRIWEGDAKDWNARDDRKPIYDNR